MGVTDVLKDDIAGKVNYIKENFTKYKDANNVDQYVLDAYLKNRPNSGFLAGTTSFGTTSLRSIIDYTTFKTTGITASCPPPTSSPLIFKNTNGTWGTSPEAWSSITNTDGSIKYNLVEFFALTNCSTSRNELEKIGLNYDLLRNNWGSFKNLLTVTLLPYNVSGSKSSQTWTGKYYDVAGGNVYNSSTSPFDLHTGFDLDKAVDHNEINLFVCQRILYLFIIVSEIYAAMYMWEIYTIPASPGSDITPYLQNLLLNRLNTFTKINDDFTKGADTDVSEVLRNEYGKYTANQNTINNAKVELERIQLDLANNKSYMDGQSKIAKKMSTLSMISWVIGVAVIVAILAVYFIPLEPAQKRTTMISLFAFGALLSLLFYFIGRSIQKEAFVGSYNDLSSVASNATTVVKGDYATGTLYPFVLQQISEYLTNTVMIANQLQTTQVYLNVNDAMSQQANYYDGTLKQMGLGSEKADNLAKILYLDSTVAYSNVIFVIGLLLIVSVTALLSIVVKGGGRNVILVIAGILLFLLCLIYILRIAPRVRTDAHKYYWGKPAQFSKS